MIVYLKLNTPIGSGYGTSFTLTANAGTVTPSTATLTQLTNGLLVDVSVSASSVTITSVGPCNNPIVLPITRTTTTTTIPPTTTTTTIAVCIPPCGAIYMANPGNKLYYYNLISPTVGISTSIPNPSLVPISGNGDIANTTSKFFIGDCIGDPYTNPTTAFGKITKYDYTSCPVSYSNPIVLTTAAGKAPIGLCAKDNNTLISTRRVASSSSIVMEIDVNSGVTTDKFSLDTVSWRTLVGDLYYVSSSNILYATNRVGADNFITNYNYTTGAIINDVNINAIATNAYGLTAIGSSIYIFNYVAGSPSTVYRVDSMSGSGTFTRMPDGFNGVGAATTPPGCGAPTTTTTTAAPTTTSTTTVPIPTTTSSTTAAPTTTTTTVATGSIYYNIGGGSGARLIITNSSTGAVILDKTTDNHTGSSFNIFGTLILPLSVNYNVNVYWTSGSGNILSTRVCDLTDPNASSLGINYLRGDNSVYPLLLNYTLSTGMRDISVNVRTQGTDAPTCPIN
jgi:hypothetical protein